MHDRSAGLKRDSPAAIGTGSCSVKMRRPSHKLLQKLTMSSGKECRVAPSRPKLLNVATRTYIWARKCRTILSNIFLPVGPVGPVLWGLLFGLT